MNKVMERETFSLTEKLSRHAVELPPSAISAKVFAAARRALTDTIGCGLRGSVSVPARAVLNALHLPDLPGRFLCLNGTLTQSAYQAAFINGTAAHSLELDDTDARGLTHPGVVIIPAALAVAQDLPDTTFEDLLAAIIVGYDVAVRLARWVNPDHRLRGFHTTGTITSLGAVAAVARLRNFSIEQCASAMGIALSSAAGSFEFVSDGSNLKRVHAGKSAAAGVQACDLALHGVEGPRNALDGNFGFFTTSVSDTARPINLDDLGETFSIEQVGTKRHACCRFCHTAIDVAIDLYDRGLQIEETTQISVAVSSLCHAQTGNKNPTNELQRQFSTPYGVALGLLTGTTTLSEYQEAPNQEALRLAQKITMLVDPRIPPESRRATIDLLTGTVHYGHQLENPRGEQESQFSAEEMRLKFLNLASPVATEPATIRLYNLLQDTNPHQILSDFWDVLQDYTTHESNLNAEGESWKTTSLLHR